MLAVVVALVAASSGAAQDSRIDAASLQLELDCDSEPTFGGRTDVDIEWEINRLRRDRKDVRIAGPGIGVALSILGMVFGTWLLSYGMAQTVESSRLYEPPDSCSTGSEGEGWCVSRPAPYAGAVLIGINSFTLGQSIKKLRKKRSLRRRYARHIEQLEGTLAPESQ